MKIFRKAGKAAGQVFRFILLLGPVFLMCAPIFSAAVGGGPLGILLKMRDRSTAQYLAPLFGNAEGGGGISAGGCFPNILGRTLLKLLLYTASVLYGVLEFLKAGGGHIGEDSF